jgi:lambda family phage portal protein
MSTEAATVVSYKEHAAGGYEGAERTSREMANWNPSNVSINQQLAADKDTADARAVDMVQNDGMAIGAVSIHRDSIVGARYVLNAKPNYEVIGATPEWAEQFQLVAESRFNLLAESPSNWLDASRMNTLTGMIRLAIGMFMLKGEVTATVEWLPGDPNRPCKTAIQMFDPARLSNPDGQYDSEKLRKGVRIDTFGAPLGYHIRQAHPGDGVLSVQAYRWKYVPAAKPWGRPMVIHIIEQLLPHQNRGIADMVAALKNMRMTKKFSEITLQNAVVNASVAAVLESDLPPEAVYAMMGAGGGGTGVEGVNSGDISGYLNYLASYMGAAKNLHIDGAKIPHVPPGSKLNLKPMGTPGGVGTDFEASLLRHTAASLGMSYEEFARDFTKTNYSSARAAMAQTEKYMQSRKKLVADKMATMIYSLWVEEEINNGTLPLPPGMTIADFYKPLMRDAFSECEWIGASRGQIDEKKETEAAQMRIDSGFSTIEAEAARLGGDWRQIMRQRAREEKVAKEYGLTFGMRGANNQGNQADQSEDKPKGADDAETN